MAQQPKDSRNTSSVQNILNDSRPSKLLGWTQNCLPNTQTTINIPVNGGSFFFSIFFKDAATTNTAAPVWISDTSGNVLPSANGTATIAQNEKSIWFEGGRLTFTVEKEIKALYVCPVDPAQTVTAHFIIGD